MLLKQVPETTEAMLTFPLPGEVVARYGSSGD